MAALAAVGLATGLAQTLFSALQTEEVKEMCFMFRCESQLVKLQDTMSTIKAVLLDVESKRQGLTHEGQLWVEKLKDAVYDIDDLLDEFTTIAQQRKQDAKFSKKVDRFFSRNNKFFVSFNVSREIKLLREKLEAIAKNHADFGFTDVTKPVKRREETSSTISELEVIGREDDKEAIVGMLLSDQDHSSDQNVAYVSIVGIGGLGKTTLAQLVYNDDRVKGAFSERKWVCVSEEFGTKEILGKMLGNKDLSHLTLEELQRQARTLLERKKYLLVLDDVWNESHDEWRKLKPFLVSGGSGSKIIVTTRSKQVASSIGKESITYELQGLSKENSWSLFKRIAFGEREDQIDTDLVEIGKVILKKCANVPLSVRVIASLLYGEDKSQWRLFRDIDLAKMCNAKDSSIMPTLMFSYYNLSPELKSCFSFCSLFPKDYVIRRKLLISLWLAQGFLVATHVDGQSIEDVGERYFTILLNRCFFQDIQLDNDGEVDTCKMHDLMHDLALEVAGKESSIITSANENHTRDKIRHLSISEFLKPNLCSVDTLRTFIRLYPCERYLLYGSETLPSKDVKAIISKGRRLRVLDLSSTSNVKLPNSVGKLLHLRYLDLSDNVYLKKLPKTITKLHNLQILVLKSCTSLEELPEDTSKLHNLRILQLTNCYKLKELPEDTSKLVNLRTLDINGCNSVTHMPRGMNNLKNLHTLPVFVVGGVDSKQVQGSKLVDLQALTRLKGDLHIKIPEFSSSNMPCATEKAFLLKDVHNLEIKCCKSSGSKVDQSEVHETLLEEVCPNADVRRIQMVGYEGKKMPNWATMVVTVKVSNVKGLQYVTSSLSQLCHLKVVVLWNLPNVEYIESHEAWAAVSTHNNKNDSKAVFFPVLEKLRLLWMPKLKGWWSGVRWEEMGGVGTAGGCLVDAAGGMVRADTLPSFPRLHELDIVCCMRMMYFPPCPHVKRLQVKDVNETLTFCMEGGIVASAVMTYATSTSTTISASASSSSTSGSRFLCSDHVSIPVPLCLEKLKTNSGRVMNSVLKEFVGGAVDIELGTSSFCFYVDVKERMGTAREGFERCASSLRHLTIEFDIKLRGIGIQHLTNLQSLKMYQCRDEFGEENEEEEEERMPWKNLQSLSTLEFKCCRNMVKLPKGIRYLGTSLQSLSIQSCHDMEELGECIGFLTSLHSLRFTWCDKLKALPESLKFLTSLQLLYIESCRQLKSLPDAIRHLTSLTTLDIKGSCNKLLERCQEPDGEDWSKICHIPNFNIW